MPRHLPHAPIREAIIDIQVEPRDGLTVDDLEQRIPKADFGYYVKGPISEGVFGFTLPPDGRNPAMDATTTQVGLRLDAHREPYALQWRRTGFTLSRLQWFDPDGVPYPEHANIVGWQDQLEKPDDDLKHFWMAQAQRMAPHFSFKPRPDSEP